MRYYLSLHQQADTKVVKDIINDPTIWQYLKTVVRALFPGIIILRLADADTPNMDKLYFYVCRLDKCLSKSKELLDTIQDKLFNCIRTNYGKITSEDDDGFATEDAESSDDELDELTAASSLGGFFIDSWTNRKSKLVHDFSISGWLLCPLPEVLADARKNHSGSDRKAMEKLFRKLFLQPGVFGGNESDRIAAVNLFWTEFEQFQSCSGEFGGSREYIWATTTDLVDGSSYLWHQKYSYRFTVWLGKFACRVTSKILGIGAAERNWGEVKHLKTDKRSHLSGDRTKKQATIFGSDCAQRAKFQRVAVKRGNDQEETQFMFWDDGDFDEELAFDHDAHKQLKRGPMRIINCWVENWEAAALLSQDAVSEAKILKKYGGLEWIDIDNEILCRAGECLKWLGKRQKGWSIVGFTENWVETDPNRDQNMEFWNIFDDCPLHDCLLEYYTKKKSVETNILAVRLDGTSIDDEDDDVDGDGAGVTAS